MFDKRYYFVFFASSSYIFNPDNVIFIHSTRPKTKTPVVKVVEPEKHDEVEDMEVVDTIREERLERVRRRKLEWQANVLCKEMIWDMIGDTVKKSEDRMCSDIVTTFLVDRRWKDLELRRIPKGALCGCGHDDKHQK